MSVNKLHPRNKHQGQYNFDILVKNYPDLKPYIVKNKNGEDSINFHDNKSVIALNKALLLSFYPINYWSIPDNYLCPPIPSRSDYIHYLADCLYQNGLNHKKIHALDIGTGANLIYPLIGTQEYNWKFTATDIDPTSINNAQEIIDRNKTLQALIELRSQKNERNIFKGVITENDFFEISICNPPFHNSKEDAEKGTYRKLKNLGKKEESLSLNFGGKHNELWCSGGELAFVKQIMNESLLFKNQCIWFSSLISKKDNLKPLKRHLKKLNVHALKTIEMLHGQKHSRILIWTFLNEKEITHLLLKNGRIAS